MTRIYLATSWRNPRQPAVVAELRDASYDVYDFRNPNGGIGFGFTDVALVDPSTGSQWDHNACSATTFVEALGTPLAREGFDRDYQAMQLADIVVLLLPCERDAHLELGWAVGVGKETHILLDDPCKASLMYQMVDYIHEDLNGLLYTLEDNRQRQEYASGH